jgi:hypothetical protein
MMVCKRRLVKILSVTGVSIVAAILAGCGGSSSDAASVGSPASNSSLATIALSASSYLVAPSSSAVITINRTGPSAGVASVNYSTVNGTAVAGTDFVATSGNLTWDDGDTSAKTVIVPIASQAGGKVFAIKLTDITGQAQFGQPSSAAVNVVTSNGLLGVGSGTKSASLSWTAPTQNTNGTALTNLVGYNIYYGTSSSAMTNRININTVGILSYVIENLSSGSWYFALTAVNSAGAESLLSSTVEATL